MTIKVQRLSYIFNVAELSVEISSHNVNADTNIDS